MVSFTTQYDSNFENFKCHFRDVIKRLTRKTLEAKFKPYRPQGIKQKHLIILDRAWKENFSDLKTAKSIKDFDCGKLLAAIFIASSVRNVLKNQKYKRQKLLIQKRNQMPAETKFEDDKVLEQIKAAEKKKQKKREKEKE